jgi:hypothetical protein
MHAAMAISTAKKSLYALRLINVFFNNLERKFCSSFDFGFMIIVVILLILFAKIIIALLQSSVFYIGKVLPQKLDRPYHLLIITVFPIISLKSS